MPDRSHNPQPIAHALDAVPPGLSGGVVAIGNFDGLHRGHAELLRLTVAAARRRGVPAVVLTFEPHPRTFFRPEAPVFRLTPLPAKERVAAAIGVDGLIVAPFDRSLSEMRAEAFIDSVLASRLAARAVVVGPDFRFGKGRAGSAATLTAEGGRHGFDVLIVDPVLSADDSSVSSSAAREALSAGDVARANELLGYRWFIVGEVVPGDRRGRDLGFPTANISLPADCRLRHGIYAVRLTADGETRDGVASFGRRPTFDNGPPLLEVHLFDFEGDLYGRLVTVTFFGWIRPEARFASADDLIVAMKQDSAAARAMLAEADAGSDVDRALLARAQAVPVVQSGGMS